MPTVHTQSQAHIKNKRESLEYMETKNTENGPQSRE